MSAPKMSKTGARFDRLVIIDHAGRIGHNQAWLCRCDCGSVTRVLNSNLIRGNTRSCGRLHSEVTAAARLKHGHMVGGKPTSEYSTLQSMLARCHNPKNISFKYYGARGITVCERWHSFEKFLADMGRKPSQKHSIDRIDVNGNYEPGNCRWATAVEQAANKRIAA